MSLQTYSLSCPHEPANVTDLWEFSVVLTKGARAQPIIKKAQLTPLLHGSVFWNECLTLNWFNFKHKSIFSSSLSTALFPQLWQDGWYFCNHSFYRPLSSDSTSTLESHCLSGFSWISRKRATLNFWDSLCNSWKKGIKNISGRQLKLFYIKEWNRSRSIDPFKISPFRGCKFNLFLRLWRTSNFICLINNKILALRTAKCWV